MSTRSDRRAIQIAGWSALLLLLVVARSAVGVESALHFNGAPVDGPFQLLNALRRIDAGQRGGADFQFFHGIGLPYLHYPLYRLFGGGLAGSELARQLIAIIAVPLVFAAFFWTFTRDARRSLALTTASYAALIALKAAAVLTPQVSMLGVRSALPTLLPAIYFATRGRIARATSCGALLGVALSLSTEQGLAAVVAYVVIGVFAATLANDRRAAFGEIAIGAVVCALTFCAVLLAVGGGRGALAAAHYNLIIVPQNQYWFFGAPPANGAPDWSSVFASARQMPKIPLTIAIALWCVWTQIRRIRRNPDGRREIAMGLLALYGLVSCASVLGIFFHTYVEPCIRALVILAACEADAIVAASYDTSSRQIAGVPRPIAQLAGIAVAVMLVRVPSTVGSLISTAPHVARVHAMNRVGIQPAGDWPATLHVGEQVLAAGSGDHRSLLWSTYAGWIEAREQVINPSQFDYMMHALGPANRAQYLAVFDSVRPQYVQTLNPHYDPAEIWFEQTWWEFYRRVLRNYQAVAASPWSIYWRRDASNGSIGSVVWSAEVPEGSRTIELPIASSGAIGDTVTLLEVTLDYDMDGPVRHVPVVGAWPRYFVTIANARARYPVTLDPFTTRVAFPLLAVSGKNPRLTFEVHSLLPGARLHPRRVTVATVPVVGANRNWLALLAQTSAERLTAGPWGDTTGIYRWR